MKALLRSAKVSRIVVGHTTQVFITSRYQGQVIGIDAGLKSGQQGEMLIWDKAQFWRGLLNGQREKLAMDQNAESPSTAPP